MRNTYTKIVGALLALAASASLWAQPAAPAQPQRVYVPYKDLGALLEPVGKAVMMDRAEFEKLLAGATVAEAGSDQVELAQFASAQYVAVAGASAAQSQPAADAARASQTLALTGTLIIESLSDRAVAMPTGFSHVGLTKLLLDDKPAPLGYDKQGRMSLIVTGRGKHTLTLEGSTLIHDLAKGGVEFTLGLPATAAASLKLSAVGDLEVHASSPATAPVYDKAADRTTAEVTFGGVGQVTVTLLGNGRSEDERAIILGESASAVQLTAVSQVLTSQFNVQVLRRGVRELQFAVPAGWTITDVTCPNMVKWSISQPATAPPEVGQTLTVRLRSAERGSQAVLIKASSPFSGLTWTSPAIRLVAADYQRGYLLVDTTDDLKFKADHLTNARRENVQQGAPDQASQHAVRAAFDSFAASLLGADVASPAARLYYHWGDAWKIVLDLDVLEQRTSSEQHQDITITPEGEVTLAGRFLVTAVTKDLYDIAITVPDAEGGAFWNIESVLVNGKPTGFQYRVVDAAPKQPRTLKIELASPIRPEGVADVTVLARHQGPRVESPSAAQAQSQPASAPAVSLAMPLLGLMSNTLKGTVSVQATGDLEVAESSGAAPLKPIPSGRMALQGMGSDIQAAWSYTDVPASSISLGLTRRTARVSAESVGLLTVQSGKLVGDWRVVYNITRARQRTLFLLADKSLGANLKIDSPTLPIVSKEIVKATTPIPPAMTTLSAELVAKYDLWKLTLDGEAAGPVVLTVHYERPIEPAAKQASGAASQGARSVEAALVRPIGAEQFYEVLAIQATDELAVSQESHQVTEMDAIDLPDLPAPAKRLLWGFRLDSPVSAKGASAAVTLSAFEHGNYAVPAALALSAHHRTFVGANASQRSEATFRVVNAGVQFLGFRLPKGASLWSVRVGEAQAKPKRSGEDQYLVSLPRSSTPLVVRIVYAWNSGAAAGEFDNLTLGAVALDGIRINQSSWTVVPPPGYFVEDQASGKTRMQARDTFRTPPAYVALLDKLDSITSITGGVKGGYHDMLGGNAETAPGYGDAIQTLEHGRYAYDDGDRRTAHDGIHFFAATRRPRPALGPPKDSGSIVANEEDEVQLQEAANSESLREPNAEGTQAKTDWALQKKQEDFRQSKKPSDVTALDASKSMAVGRYTLPVELSAAPSGEPATFTALGEPSLAVSLTRTARAGNLWRIGFVLAGGLGLLLLKGTRRSRVVYVVALLALASAAAVWFDSLIHFANGAFVAGLLLVPFYLVVGFCRWIGRKLPLTRAGVSPSTTSAALLLAMLAGMAVLTLSSPALAADPATPKAAPSATPVPVPPAPWVTMPGSVIVPYDTDPTTALQGNKVFVPYGQFVRMWNLVNPDSPIEMPPAIPGVAMADAKYAMTLTAGPDGVRANISLTATIPAPALKKLKGPLSIPMPLSGMAVTEATFNGHAAALQSGPSGLLLTIPADAFDGKAEGQLALSVVATPKLIGDDPRRGSLDLRLPPLPGATMTVKGLADDVLLDAQLDGKALDWPVAPSKADGALVWTVPLDGSTALSLRWSPKAATGSADRTLTASAEHEVYAFHWALLGVTKIAYAFSAGQNDRFALLLPAGAEVRSIDGPNLRDWRVVGDRTEDGEKFKAVEVRLHRPASKSYDLTVNWLDKLPALDKPARLSLPRAADVGRESGSVTLHAAGGMGLKVIDVTGGRRTSDFGTRNDAAATPEIATPVGKYYWPYRPFAIDIQIARSIVAAKITLDQLVRLSPDQAQSFVAVNLTAQQGLLFGASFALPDGYELLSAVGPDVADWYVQTTTTPRRLHVALRAGTAATTVALALVRHDLAGKLADFEVPLVRAVDPDGKTLAEQKGRLAVQVAASLDAQTVSSAGLKPLVPSALRDWLNEPQTRAVQFAYTYEAAAPALKLSAKPLPTKVRVEVLHGLAVNTTDALYTYRLRYTVEGSPVDHVDFSLPAEFAPLVAVTCPSMRSVSQVTKDGRATWTVNLIDEVSGVLDVAVNFALPIDASTTSLPMPRIVTSAPAGYRAVVAVQNLSAHELAAGESTVLAVMPPGQQKEVLPEGILKSLQYVWQAFSDDWSLALKLTPAKRATRIAAIVDLMAITTAIDRQGQCRYEVRIELQNRSEQFLRVKLPKGVELWSAIVADQSVKPVLPLGGPADEVLIPLVKTSASALPYDVKLYLAGGGVEPLSGITKIAPPAISIIGMEVQRTTWSLRLPAGFVYSTRSAGGNMSPIAGTAEQMAIALDAKLDQFKRFEESYSSLSAGEKTVATRNLSGFNVRLNKELSEYRDYVDNNRDKLSDKDYQYLKSKEQQQSGVIAQYNENLVQKQQADNALTTQSLNWAINGSLPNAGVSEQYRNKALNDIPDFYNKANTGNIAAIEKELSDIKSNVSKPRGVQSPVPTPTPQAGKRAAELTEGKEALAEPQKAEQAQLGDDQYKGKIAQLEQKKLQLTDNRVGRMYQQEGQAQGKGQGREGQQWATQASRPTGAPQPSGPGNVSALPNGQGGPGPAPGPGVTNQGGQAMGPGWGNQPTTQPVAAPGRPGEGDKKDAPAEAGYVSAGTYSLPVELPAGEVQLDFAHPSGQVSLGLWAIPESLVRSLWGTAGVLIALVIVWAFARVLGRMKAQGRRSWWTPLAYGLFLMLGLFVASWVGLVLAAVLIFFIELARRLGARRRAS